MQSMGPSLVDFVVLSEALALCTKDVVPLLHSVYSACNVNIQQMPQHSPSGEGYPIFLKLQAVPKEQDGTVVGHYDCRTCSGRCWCCMNS